MTFRCACFTGVYAESHRNSRWIKVDDDGTLTLPSMPYTISEDVDQSDGDMGISPDLSAGAPKDGIYLCFKMFII